MGPEDSDDDEPLLNRQYRKRLVFSVAFVWPEGVPWKGTTTHGRNGPEWYFDCLLDMMSRHVRSHFIIHMHDAIRNVIQVETFGRAIHISSTFELRFCAADRPAMWPNVERFVPVFDSDEERMVVALDIHDDPDEQDDTVSHHTRNVADGIILTFWPTNDEDYAAASFRDPNVGPPPQLEAVHPTYNKRWIVDGGLMVSTKRARNVVRESLGSFSDHLSRCAVRFEWDPEQKNGTDEAILQLFLLSFRPGDETLDANETVRAADTVMRHVRPYVHNLSRRASDPPRSHALLRMQPVGWGGPAYIRTTRNKKFVYDGEGVFRHRGRIIPLEWKLRPGARASRRPRGA